MYNPDLSRHTTPTRPQIYLVAGKVYHSGQTEPMRIVFREGLISIGCSDISEDAIKYIVAQYSEWITRREKILQ
jgi:hypothetical protein